MPFTILQCVNKDIIIIIIIEDKLSSGLTTSPRGINFTIILFELFSLSHIRFVIFSLLVCFLYTIHIHQCYMYVTVKLANHKAGNVSFRTICDFPKIC